PENPGSDLARGESDFLLVSEQQPRCSPFPYSRGKRFRKSSLKRLTSRQFPSEIPKSQYGAWLPAGWHPKYKAHARAEETHEWPAALSEFSKPTATVLPCPAISPKPAATLDVHAFARLQGLS